MQNNSKHSRIGKRPDLDIRYLSKHGIYGDISITEPVNSSLTLNNSKHSLRAAKARENQKINEYGVISEQAGHEFIPLVIESYGAWGSKMVEFFNRVINHASEARSVRKDILAIYWRRRLAVTLHKAIAEAILKKIGRARGGPFRDESNWEGVLEDQQYVRSSDRA
jgi:hypothetical protein